jgi:hypothetical protein
MRPRGAGTLVQNARGAALAQRCWVTCPLVSTKSPPGRGAPTSTEVDCHCSFCGAGTREVRQLIAGPSGVFICDRCLVLCIDLIEEMAEERARPAFRHCLVHADDPRYYTLQDQLAESRKLLEAVEPVIPPQYTALRESIAAVLRPVQSENNPHPPTPAPNRRSRRTRS